MECQEGLTLIPNQNIQMKSEDEGSINPYAYAAFSSNIHVGLPFCEVPPSKRESFLS